MNPGSNEIAGAGTATEALRLEVERCRRELDGCRQRTAELDQAEALLAGEKQNTDIDERKRVEALVAGEKRLLEMVARGDALAGILDSLCRLAEELTGGASASILLVSADGKRLRHEIGRASCRERV